MNLSLGFPEGPHEVAARRPGLDAVVSSFEALQREADSPVRAIHHQPAKDGQYSAIPASVDPRLRAALAARGIHQLYVHQAEAVDVVERGRNVVVVTPTASGKTLCYNLPVLN